MPVYYHVNYCRAAQALVHCQRYALKQVFNYYFYYLIAASNGIHVMAEICQKVLDGFGMPTKCALSIVVPIFKGKGGVRKCSCHGGVELLEHRMKVVGRVLQKNAL